MWYHHHIFNPAHYPWIQWHHIRTKSQCWDTAIDYWTDWWSAAASISCGFHWPMPGQPWYQCTSTTLKSLVQARLPGLLYTWLQPPPVKDERVRAPDVWSAVLAWKWDWVIYKIYRRKKWMIHWRLAWTEHTYFWCPNDTLSRLLLNLEHHPPVVAWL